MVPKYAILPGIIFYMYYQDFGVRKIKGFIGITIWLQYIALEDIYSVGQEQLFLF